MSQMHLGGAGTQREGEQLVAEADAEDRQARGQEPAYHGNRKDAGRRWITGTVGKKDPVGPQGEDRRRRAARRDDGDAAAETGKAAQDIVLDPVVHADDVTVREPDGFAIAALYGP